MKNRKELIIKVAVVAIVGIGVCSAQAALIASEGFYTTAASDTYGPSIAIGNPSYRAITNGNSGFVSGKVWEDDTSYVRTENTGLSHSGVTGTDQYGKLGIRAGSNVDRTSERALGSAPSGSTFYFSGLVRASTSFVDGDARMLGFSRGTATMTSFNYDEGMLYGLHKAEGTVSLAAFAGGNIYDLLTIDSGDVGTVYQVVLKLDVNLAGDDKLSAWYAADGATELTQILNEELVETYDEDWDMYRLSAQGVGASGTGTAYTYFDEVRLGTALNDVTTIPEPTTLSLFALSGLSAIALRHRFIRQ